MVKKMFKILPILFVLLIAGYSYKKFRIAPKISFPVFEVLNEKKELIKLSNNSGKLRVISFYASWCPDCKREFPKMVAAMKTSLSEAEFIAITDEGLEKMIWFKDTSKYPFTFYSLPNSFDTYDIYAIPTTYILNSKDEILYSKVGEIEWENETFINELLQKN